ncbi:hypothetical protein Mal15_25050 [Stieleria maiorica]|uniref:DUF2345 domain-containing protein n=1 Tax=Stieleria maiorica TaxID=2795974 RepID=A0A5B9MCF4_9BACT|nr:hypothetical protein [Stieleria maiorica]QEF98453.1 hypothetical protein Mal15_25050 [Stieleria maiorica]
MTQTPSSNTPHADATIVPLRHGQSLRLQDDGQRQSVHLMSVDGKCRLEIQITESGPVLMLNGAGLQVSVDGPLAFDAGKVSIHARDSMALSTDGDLSLKSGGEMHSVGRSQSIESELGDVNVKANDDVRLNGERVRVNC